MSLQTKPNTTLASTRFTVALERRVHHYVRKHSVLSPGEPVVVAVSGGADSTALLVLLSHLSTQLGLDLTVAHFDHQLRTPEEAAEDLDFVRSLASALDLPLVHGSGDVRAHANEHHLSLEDAARRLRYAFLAEQAATGGASSIAVGHTLDDQAETVLLHLIRGAGLAGIAAMSPRAPWPFGAGPQLARPLLALRRQDTERYCRDIGVEPRHDPSNELPFATRNRVRHELLPVLRRLNPRIENALARLATTAATDARFLDELAAAAFSPIAESRGAFVTLPRSDLAALPPPLAARVIRYALSAVRGAAAGVESTHLDAVLEALKGPPGALSLPGGVTAIIDPSTLTLSRGPLQRQPRIEPARLAIPGTTAAGSWRITASLEIPPLTPATHNPLESYLDADKVGTDLTVRARRPGDRLRPLGLGGEKKLQDILVDAKVPARDRDAAPLVCVGDQVAWVVGHCIDERFAISVATRQALHLTASRQTDN